MNLIFQRYRQLHSIEHVFYKSLRLNKQNVKILTRKVCISGWEKFVQNKIRIYYDYVSMWKKRQSMNIIN